MHSCCIKYNSNAHCCIADSHHPMSSIDHHHNYNYHWHIWNCCNIDYKWHCCILNNTGIYHCIDCIYSWREYRLVGGMYSWWSWVGNYSRSWYKKLNYNPDSQYRIINYIWGKLFWTGRSLGLDICKYYWPIGNYYRSLYSSSCCRVYTPIRTNQNNWNSCPIWVC